MELLKDILARALEKEEINVTFPNLKMSAKEIVEGQCYSALNEIKAIIENDALSDFECVEEIVRVFEKMGSGGGYRHDFS